MSVLEDTWNDLELDRQAPTSQAIAEWTAKYPDVDVRPHVMQVDPLTSSSTHPKAPRSSSSEAGDVAASARCSSGRSAAMLFTERIAQWLSCGPTRPSTPERRHSRRTCLPYQGCWCGAGGRSDRTLIDPRSAETGQPSRRPAATVFHVLREGRPPSSYMAISHRCPPDVDGTGAGTARLRGERWAVVCRDACSSVVGHSGWQYEGRP